jgi:hypothetical protein
MKKTDPFFACSCEPGLKKTRKDESFSSADCKTLAGLASGVSIARFAHKLVKKGEAGAIECFPNFANDSVNL